MPTKRSRVRDLADRAEQIDTLRKSIDSKLNERFGTPLYQTYMQMLGWINDESNYQTDIVGSLRTLAGGDVDSTMLDEMLEDINSIADAANGTLDGWEATYEDDPAEYFRQFYETFRLGQDLHARLMASRTRLRRICQKLSSKYE